MTQVSSYQRPNQYHHGNLQQSLLSVALEALETGRLAKLSLRSLARECGVSQTAPYRHFASKEHLLAVLSENGVEKLLLAMNTVRLEISQPFECVEQLMQVYVDFATQHSAYFQLIFNSRSIDRQRFPSLLRCLHKITAVFAEPLSRLGGQFDLPNLAHMLWAEAHGLATLATNSLCQIEDISQQQTVKQFVEMLVQTIDTSQSATQELEPELLA